MIDPFCVWVHICALVYNLIVRFADLLYGDKT
jgi:hypothetical protein